MKSLATEPFLEAARAQVWYATLFVMLFANSIQSLQPFVIVSVNEIRCVLYREPMRDHFSQDNKHVILSQEVIITM